ncbi:MULTISPECIES: peptidase inhibitor family I36 protein [unclassified Streptomyces]|uniref:peptidase inhibitor family I36 protein n=1 Tax=unclassified Streptomyces TaxID=2593676 RepID=UPI000B67FC98|nr:MULTISPECIES: peptidase inhibitor family I36 protein [unclassified Streptomyces]SNB88637.1 Peptidase inhibitor family I36 [Streptomyces sp. PgraA7]
MRKIKGVRAKAAIASGAVLLAGLGMAATASPAQAAKSDCSSGALCAWLSSSYAGTPGQVWGNNTNLRQYDKFNNAGSVYNNGNSCDVRIYTLMGYEGRTHLLKRGASISGLRTHFSDGRFGSGIASNTWVC